MILFTMYSALAEHTLPESYFKKLIICISPVFLLCMDLIMLWGITFFVPVGKPCDSTGLGSLFYFTVTIAKSL